MGTTANRLRWDGRAGHYEVYYLTLTDPATGVGVWIRYTMLAPLDGREPTCALWLATMDPRDGAQPVQARKQTFPIGQLQSRAEPFELRIGEAILTDGSMKGAFHDVAWELSWAPAPSFRAPVAPWLHAAGLAHTALVLPQVDASIDGWVKLGQERLELGQARGGQAHLWGSKHATRWAWAHCNDLCTPAGEPVGDLLFDGVSAVVTRFGRRVGPSTPVVGQVGRRQFESTSPVRILANRSRFGLEGWRFEAADGSHRLFAEVRPSRDQLVGVTYEDPDGEKAYCYNSETASVRLEVYERSRRTMGWRASGTFLSVGRCHFEYGQRAPVTGVELLLT
ncbi:MAG TPA: hypothetical protein VE983_10295 [Solirubrobacteraceae bacterium]|nr:hypothetical protein [Solirubrobacteraceae bacterium]